MKNVAQVDKSGRQVNHRPDSLPCFPRVNGDARIPTFSLLAVTDQDGAYQFVAHSSQAVSLPSVCCKDPTIAWRGHIYFHPNSSNKASLLLVIFAFAPGPLIYR